MEQPQKQHSAQAMDILTPFYNPFFELKRPLASIDKPRRLQQVCITNLAKGNIFKIQGFNQIAEWVKFFNEIIKFHVHVLEIKNAQMSSIIDYLSAIQFTKLRDLCLFGNKIASLQNFHKIPLSELKTLRIDQNQITSLRPLKKCSFPLLQQIDLQSNEWSDPQWLTEMHAPKLMAVRLEGQQHRYPRNDDKKWFAKLQTPQLNYIRCPSPLRIQQKIVDNMLQMKYCKLTVMRKKSGEKWCIYTI